MRTCNAIPISSEWTEESGRTKRDKMERHGHHNKNQGRRKNQKADTESINLNTLRAQIGKK